MEKEGADQLCPVRAQDQLQPPINPGKVLVFAKNKGRPMMLPLPPEGVGLHRPTIWPRKIADNFSTLSWLNEVRTPLTVGKRGLKIIGSNFLSVKKSGSFESGAEGGGLQPRSVIDLNSLN